MFYYVFFIVFVIIYQLTYIFQNSCIY